MRIMNLSTLCDRSSIIKVHMWFSQLWVWLICPFYTPRCLPFLNLLIKLISRSGFWSLTSCPAF